MLDCFSTLSIKGLNIHSEIYSRIKTSLTSFLFDSIEILVYVQSLRNMRKVVLGWPRLLQNLSPPYNILPRICAGEKNYGKKLIIKTA